MRVVLGYSVGYSVANYTDLLIFPAYQLTRGSPYGSVLSMANDESQHATKADITELKSDIQQLERKVDNSITELRSDNQQLERKVGQQYR